MIFYRFPVVGNDMFGKYPVEMTMNNVPEICRRSFREMDNHCSASNAVPPFDVSQILESRLSEKLARVENA